MNGSIIKRKSWMYTSLSVLLFLLLSSSISDAIDSNAINDISAEERAALKDKTIWGILSEREQRSLPLERVTKLMVIKLKDESVTESISKLHEPGPHSFGRVLATSGRLIWKTGIPLPKDADGGVADLWEILNNRRFVKLIQELRTLPKAEVAVLVNRDIEASLVEYDRLYNSYFKESLKYYESVKGDLIGRAISLGPAPISSDPTPTLEGLRNKILALTLAVGNLELRDSQAVVQKVVDYAIRQRDKLYDKKLFEEQFASLMLDSASLYNRQILGTAVLGTYLTPDEANQILADINAGFRERKLKPYDELPPAKQQPCLPGMMALTLLDDTDGEIQIRHIEPLLDDTQFDKLLTDGKVRIKHIGPLDDSQFDKLVEAANKARSKSIMLKKNSKE